MLKCRYHKDEVEGLCAKIFHWQGGKVLLNQAQPGTSKGVGWVAHAGGDVFGLGSARRDARYRQIGVGLRKISLEGSEAAANAQNTLVPLDSGPLAYQSEFRLLCLLQRGVRGADGLWRFSVVGH